MHAEIEMVRKLEQALSAILRELPAEAGKAAEAGAIEYRSWFTAPDSGAVEYNSWLRG